MLLLVIALVPGILLVAALVARTPNLFLFDLIDDSLCNKIP